MSGTSSLFLWQKEISKSEGRIKMESKLVSCKICEFPHYISLYAWAPMSGDSNCYLHNWCFISFKLSTPSTHYLLMLSKMNVSRWFYGIYNEYSVCGTDHLVQRTES